MKKEINLPLAQEVYEGLCAALDNRGWHYEKDEEKFVVFFGVNGEDIPMQFIIVVDPERELVRLLSQLPFSFGEDKRIDGALAVCMASSRLVDGSFDYDMTDGSVVFRCTASYCESRIGDGMFQHMIDCATFSVDLYNDKFLAVAKGLLPLSDFIADL